MYIALRVLILIAFFLLLIFVFLKRLSRSRTDEVLKRFSGKEIILLEKAANFFGQESLGYAQIRGNGTLLLTGDEIFFQMWLPKKELQIPLSSILSVEVTRSHLGKTKGVRLLKVTFKNPQQERDSVAWIVRDVDRWVNFVKERINH
ncbi:MAG: hypothetical protein D6726_10585 [Nitrospirae bacterium]|nr:MAG: hypothetical protein D6726_10585 [Nitrospirota bacterium]